MTQKIKNGNENKNKNERNSCVHHVSRHMLRQRCALALFRLLRGVA